MRYWIGLLVFLFAAPALALEAAAPDARTILERATEAAGGADWLNPFTLQLSGHAVFYGPDSAEPRSRSDDYRMWRVFDPDRTASHNAQGKVRIRAGVGDGVMFEVGYDGETTWTQDGIMPREEADAYWASAFGFGIIRRALGEGFTLTRIPDGNSNGHPTYKIRITDPGGAETIFGIDQQSHYIRTMEFATPRGWHMRVYDDFYRLEDPDWVQAGTVTLSYNGTVSNTVTWTETVVNAPIGDDVFTYPGGPSR
ncbi:hypothetical protein HFP57_14380 [Parasphingopyxis algicola]|uniref:hypothetical protein n=1 Tax=Parasphingopyxis algicola TaxID=2026624 RepID=UPI0015A481C1|nr:hypothetical protein [Parasphingopyxis algicola]QLC26091.1 hypothetical protein HFP57_14380 [Parasphingopyxis algicola]